MGARPMMPDAAFTDVTALLKAWRGGDAGALDRLTPIVYEHLRRLGRQYVRKERAGARGDATSLVHEAFIRLVDAQKVDWQDRAHFLAVCSRDHAAAAGGRRTCARGDEARRRHAARLTPRPAGPRKPAGAERALTSAALDDSLRTMARRSRAVRR